MDLKYENGGCDRGLCSRGCHTGHYCQLNTYDYLADIPGNDETSDLVEVQFKNTRKGYYHNINRLPLEKGDIVAVEANPGHDIGTVTLTGKLAALQMKRANLKPRDEIRNIYRKVKPLDMEKYAEAKAREHDTMIRSRQIAQDLGLQMKIGDVEYQGDGNKAIFYYIADGRVDFRQLIKVLAEAFRVRIEMKQIGARQEAGRIGGFGPCGRELCCATWMKNFVSVNTGAARFQDLSLNPQKLAGQCAKLKCCLNYEVDQYLEASKALPGRDVSLQTTDGEYFLFKSDILTGMVTYSTDKRMAANLVTIPASRAKEVIELNRNGEKPDQLLEGTNHEHKHKPIDLATQEDVSRFDKKKKKKKKKANAEAAADKPEPNIQESAQEPTAADKPKARKNGNRNKQGKPRKPKSSADVPPQE
ncbi:MAG: regulatory iron-sulfur-containing complex subunit RicT [Bacteroidaceae bacterium]|nr:regulatory iron-sulfur-containing complex subunit RicT [Bacteroidaceae bacterium]